MYEIVENKDIVWIPCKIIEHTENSDSLKYVQPLDGWEHNRLWTSNFRKEECPNCTKILKFAEKLITEPKTQLHGFGFTMVYEERKKIGNQLMKLMEGRKS